MYKFPCKNTCGMTIEYPADKKNMNNNSVIACQKNDGGASAEKIHRGGAQGAEKYAEKKIEIREHEFNCSVFMPLL
jgi:hypothetical protein